MLTKLFKLNFISPCVAQTAARNICVCLTLQHLIASLHQQGVEESEAEEGEVHADVSGTSQSWARRSFAERVNSYEKVSFLHSKQNF